ncbi:uncharacterized protein METZ01_LOCUS377629 [marine metagenome]|uniref:Uncharacterized protein n=1 Tax=marine metagenome TaxID=408172 RepID=A0A382TSR8_9ZZZZ
MEDFKLTTPIPLQKNINPDQPKICLVDSITASICGASIPAIVFYLLV